MDNRVKVLIGILAISIIGLLIFRKAFSKKSDELENLPVYSDISIPLASVR